MRTSILFLVTALALPLVSLAQTTNESVLGSLPLATIYEGGPAMPSVQSADYPDSNRWYSKRDATFSWDLAGDITAVAVDVATSSGKEPMTTYRPAVSSVTLEADKFVEGVNYVTVQLRNEQKWGMYGEKIVRIDATAPEAFQIDVQPVNNTDSLVKLSFNTFDALSGVDYYELSVDSATPIRLTSPSQEVSLANGATRHVTVRAYDKAGNYTEESTTLLGVVSPIKTPSNIIEVATTEPSAILAALMSALLLMMFGYLIYERQRYGEAVKTLRRETSEIHEQSLRIFTALREEIYEQIASIAQKSRLSKKEKEVIENLNKALSVSETLIEKEVSDVKDLLD